MRVTTNHKWRQFIYRYDVPSDVLASEFDYQDPEEATDGFFRYRGVWYHIDQFAGDVPPVLKGKWHGWRPDSFFSGVAIRFSDDCEEYQVATVIA